MLVNLTLHAHTYSFFGASVSKQIGSEKAVIVYIYVHCSLSSYPLSALPLFIFVTHCTDAKISFVRRHIPVRLIR